MKHDKLFTMSIHECDIHLGSTATTSVMHPAGPSFCVFSYYPQILKFSSRNFFFFTQNLLRYTQDLADFLSITLLFSSKSAFATDLNI